jgi:hypothetical protein
MCYFIVILKTIVSHASKQTQPLGPLQLTKTMHIAIVVSFVMVVGISDISATTTLKNGGISRLHACCAFGIIIMLLNI